MDAKVLELPYSVWNPIFLFFMHLILKHIERVARLEATCFFSLPSENLLEYLKQILPIFVCWRSFFFIETLLRSVEQLGFLELYLDHDTMAAN